MEIPRAREDVRTPSLGGVSVPTTPAPSFGDIRIPTGDLTKAAGAMGAGADKLISVLREHGERMADADMRREIVGAEAGFMDDSRRVMLDVDDMRGQAQALPDKETGQGGIYNTAKERTTALLDKYVGQYTGKYADALNEKLRSHQANTLNAAASLQAQEQERDYDRKAGLVIDQYGQQVATSRGDRLQTYLALNQGVDSLATLYGVNPKATDPAQNGRWAQYVAAKNKFVTHIAQQAIFSSMDVDPAAASGHLERFGPWIDQQSMHVLKGMVDKAAKEKSAEDTYWSMQGIPFAEQARLTGLITDLDVRSRVSTLITADEHRKQASLSSTIHAAEEEWRGKINAAKADPSKWQDVSVQGVLKDKRLDERGRGALLDELLGRKNPENDWNKLIERTRLENEIVANPDRWDRDSIVQAFQKQGLPSTEAVKGVSTWEHAFNNPSLGPAKETLRNELYDPVFSDRDKAAKFDDALHTWAKAFQKERQRPPSYDEITDYGRKLAKPQIDRAWWKFNEPNDPKATFLEFGEKTGTGLDEKPKGYVNWTDEAGVQRRKYTTGEETWVQDGKSYTRTVGGDILWKEGRYLYRTESRTGKTYRKEVE